MFVGDHVLFDLAVWVNSLQHMLKAEQLSARGEIIEQTKKVWEKIVKFGTTLCLASDPLEFNLIVDYSSNGCGYALFAGSREDGNLVGLNSKGSTDKAVSSYLGEPQGICWALNKTRSIAHSKRLILWNDFESSYKRIRRCDAYHKCLYDSRVARLLSWLWTNFTAVQL